MVDGVDADIAVTRHVRVEDLSEEPHYRRAQGIPGGIMIICIHKKKRHIKNHGEK